MSTHAYTCAYIRTISYICGMVCVYTVCCETGCATARVGQTQAGGMSVSDLLRIRRCLKTVS